MTTAPYAGLSPRRRRRLRAEELGLSFSRPDQRRSGEDQPSPPLSSAQANALVREAVAQTVATLRAGAPSARRRVGFCGPAADAAVSR